MKKLRLDLDALDVESFATLPPGRRRSRTVNAHQHTDEHDRAGDDADRAGDPAQERDDDAYQAGDAAGKAGDAADVAWCEATPSCTRDID